MSDAPRHSRKAIEAYAGLGDFTPQICDALGFDLDAGEVSADWCAALALADLGARLVRVVAEPAYRVKSDLAARDHALGRPTMHLAPQWRFPLTASGSFAEEQGRAAIVIPVGAFDGPAPGWTATTLTGGAGADAEAFRRGIVDLIALPLGGGRPLSFTGFTAAVGSFEPQGGRVALHAGGRAWLDAFLADVRGLCADTPGHLVEQLHMPFAAPASVLVVEPSALEWRICRFDCVIPAAAKEVACADSARFAEWLDAEMRKREPVRDMPKILRPRRDAQTDKARAA